MKRLDQSDLEALYQFLQNNDEDAYDHLVELYYREVRITITKIFLQHSFTYAKEVAQDQALCICQNFFMDKFPVVLRHYKPERGSLRTWILRCATNYTLDQLRAKKREGQVETLHVDEEEWKSFYALKEIAGEALLNPHHERETSELLAVIQRYIQTLPSHYREPLELRLNENLSVKEIAKRLGKPIGTIKSNLSRAITILRQRLEADGYIS